MTKPLPITPDELKSVALFEPLSDTQLRMISALMQRATFTNGEVLLSLRQPGQHVYVLQSGTVKVCINRSPSGILGADEREEKSSGKGKEIELPDAEDDDIDPEQARLVVLNLCGPGEVLGEMSFLDGLGHSADVIALEPCKTLWIEGDAFRNCIEEMPSLAMSLLQSTQHRLRFATRQLYANSTLEATGRLACQLLLFAERYGQEAPGGTLIPLRLFQRDLADMIGASRTRVNLAISLLRASGGISQTRTGSLVILDRDKLANYGQ